MAYIIQWRILLSRVFRKSDLMKRECERCGRWDNLHRHHLIYGSGYRKLSEKYNLIMYVCVNCHEEIHRGKLGLWSKQEGQRRFETKHSREEYMKIFGKNFL